MDQVHHPIRTSCVLAAALMPCAMALGHGSMSFPVSRVYSGFLEGPESPQSAAVAAAIAVGGTQPFYDWHEVVNFHPGTPEYQMDIDYSQSIPDGQLASGGNPKYAGLDLVRDDWPTTAMVSGPQQLTMHAPTPHDPKVFHAWITKPSWDTSLPLSWDQMEPVAIGPVTLDGNDYRFNAVIPARTGKHCLYVIWQRLDPAGEGFYSLSDLDFGAGTTFKCAADLDGDGVVGGADLSVVLASWGSDGADLDGDGTTDGADLATVLSGWGLCAPDCDGDGISDADEIAAGASDCDANGVPDTCDVEEDCDGDGMNDACAILGGSVDDCDGNLKPDTCDFALGGDADGNGVLDACQIDGLTYAWSVSDEWDGGFIASLSVTNGSVEVIHGWALTFDTPGYSIINLWDGLLIEESGDEALVLNAPWNGHLDPGDSVTIGFQGEGPPMPPTAVKLNGNPVLPTG